MHVIKKVRLVGEAASAREVASVRLHTGRIAASSVLALRERGGAAEPPSFEPGHVIRRDRAGTAIRPFVVDAQELSFESASLRTKPGKTDVEVSAPEQKPEPTLQEVLAARDAQWQAALDAEVAQAREEAYRAGYEDASSTLSNQYAENRKELLADLAQLSARWSEFLSGMEPTLANLSFEIAQAVLEAPLPPNLKGTAARAITEAVEQMAGSAPIEIILHPVDFLRLQESGVVEQLESLHTGMRWEPRLEMKQGGWIVQCPTMAFRRMEEELLTSLRNRLGLLAVVEKEKAQSKHVGASTPAADPPDEDR